MREQNRAPTVTPQRSLDPSRPAYPLVAAQKVIGNRAVSTIVAQRRTRDHACADGAPECESCRERRTSPARAGDGGGRATLPPIVHEVLRSPELAHAVQQRDAAGSANGAIDLLDDPVAEAQADRAAEAAPAGGDGDAGVDRRSAQPTAVVQRQRALTPLDPTTPQAWALAGRESMREQFPEEFEAILGAAPGRMLAVAEQMQAAGRPSTDAERDLFERRLRLLIRMQALGLMAAHREAVLGNRDRTLAPVGTSASPGAARPGWETAEAIRAAAGQINRLSELRKTLASSRTTLEAISRQIIISRRTSERVEAWLKQMREAIGPELSEETAEHWNRAIERLAVEPSVIRRGMMTSVLAGSLGRWRDRQIAGIDLSLRYLYQSFPFFGHVDAEEIAQKADEPLMEAVRGGYESLVASIEKVIVEIGTGDIDPYDLPAAIAVARAHIPPELHPLVDRAVRMHHFKEFWWSMGLGLFQAIVALVPVVGPAIAAGVGLAQLGGDVEQMLDRMHLAAASTEPGRAALGASAPGAFEWAMLAVGTALTVADLRGVWQQFDAARPRFDIEPEGPPSGVETDPRSAVREARGDRLAEEVPESVARPEERGAVSRPEEAVPGEAPRPGERARAAAVERGRTKSGPLTPEELDAELATVRESPTRPSTGEYVEEVELANKHVWKRRADGIWCRFSNGGAFCVLPQAVAKAGKHTGPPPDIHEYMVTEMGRFNIKARRGDPFEGHEVLMNAWLEQLGLIEKRGRGSFSRFNSAIALTSGQHDVVSDLQRAWLGGNLHDPAVLAKMTAREVIEANALILLEAGVPLERVNRIVDDALEMLPGLVGRGVAP